jgi:O-antigen ligase
MSEQRTASPALGRWGPWLALGAASAAWASVLDPIAKMAAAAALALCSLAFWTLREPRRWVGLLLVALLCLPPLPIPLGDSGPHPALFVAALGVFAGALRWREWRNPAPSASVWLILFTLVLLASAPMAAWNSGAALGAASLARVLLFSLSIYVFFYTACGPGAERDDGGRALRMLFIAGAASAVFACVDFFYQLPAPAGFGPQYVWLDLGVFRRAQGFFYEASTLGNLCVFFLVFAAVILVRRPRPLPAPPMVLLLGTCAFLAALLFSFSRGSVVGLGVALAVLLWLNRGRVRLARSSVILGVGAVGGLAVIYALSPAMVEFYWLRLRISAEQLLSGNESVFSGRLENWRYLGGFLLENPLHAILGVGYKTLPYSDFIGRPVVADNAYLSALVETGILGLAALLLFHAAILRMAWQAARSSDSQAAFHGTWMFCFWCGETVQMLSGDLLTYWRVLPVYFWVLAMAVRHTHRSRPA